MKTRVFWGDNEMESWWAVQVAASDGKEIWKEGEYRHGTPRDRVIAAIREARMAARTGGVAA